MASSSDDKARIMIWSTPRSVSTAFARSMSARGDTEVFSEPYLVCYNYGPERKANWGDSATDPRYTGMLNDKYTFSYVDKILNADYPNSKVLFVKGMVEGIRGNFDVVDAKYKHSFLVRHPEKMFRSFELMLTSIPGAPADFMHNLKTIYHDLEDFYRHVQTKFGQLSPPIIDADDLVSHPETILPKYCEAMGIEFTPKMLEWDGVDPSQLNWHCTDVGPISIEELKNTVIFSNAMQSKGLGKAPDPTKASTSSPIVAEYAEYAMPVYQRFYDLRIKP